ncbi:MAG TPA: SMP-30/gluconolactonase/LRE family protein [Steroidobacteraceae bacterium]
MSPLDGHACAELAVDCRNDLGEMPLWSAATSTLLWIDVTQPGRVFHWDTRRGVVDFWQFDHVVTGLARCRSGNRLLLVGARVICELELAGLGQHRIFSLPADQPYHRFNDGGVDAAGRFWVGCMPDNLREPFRSQRPLECSGGIYTIAADANARYFAENLGCPNAITFSPDGQRFYLADSVSGWIYAYDFDAARARISGRRNFFFAANLGIPDGAAIDAQGYLWNARWGAGVVARIDPAGELDRLIRVPTTNPTACCFGGPDLKSLYITTARYGLTDAQLGSEIYAGGVFAVRTEVPGASVWAFGN